jgi:hypothetical protein
MTSYCVARVSESAIALADLIRNGSPTAVLIMLGSLFFVSGTVLRRRLPLPGDTTRSHPLMTRQDSMRLKIQKVPVNVVANGLPAADETRSSHPSMTWERSLALSAYMGAVERAASTAASAGPVNAA